MADLFAEVDEDVRAERARAAAKRWAPLIVGLLLVVVIALGAWQEIVSQRQKGDARLSGLFFAAQVAADDASAASGPDSAHATAARSFAALGDASRPGIRTLSRLRLAQLLGDRGDKAGAIRALDAVAADGRAPEPLRELATLLSVERQIGGPNEAELGSRLLALERPGAPFRALALEAGALIALQDGHPDRTRDVLSTLVADGSAPTGLRERASTILQAIGAARPGARG